ncbi:hypothetical protein MUY27_02710 [Mucilaginibacter sp. RS28]|uniref:Uncharacterized protein n=1 Tax=Mucilaginibacter straminoryzae TaxID=2932774 RepID=A0A9X1X306_9SPHI|nr:hypothetical protein [Mucilaginibacter straminoryzae]MCJ8208603.1 hypothetical protein [Mucilaginibacter straminoryzae]
MTKTLKPKINSLLTKRVTQLHQAGYTSDFALTKGKNLRSLQTEIETKPFATTIKLVDQIYDRLFLQYKYVHTVETDNGEKGILLLPAIFFQLVARQRAVAV